jgi:hypothetical protein
MLAHRWRRIPCESFVEHLGCAMLQVGSRRTWSSVERGARKRREAQRRITLAEAWSLYPSMAAGVVPARTPQWSARVWQEEARGGGGGGGRFTVRRLQNRAAPAKSHGSGAGVERDSAGETSSRWGLRAFAK